MNTKHTEGVMTVAEILRERKPFGQDVILVVSGTKIATVINEANAERLALAWNCHDELLKALRACIEALQSAPCGCSYGFTCHSHQASTVAVNTLAKATNPNAGVVQAHPKGRW